ncbi:hypothetical protein Q9295_17195 [Xinfangfangia sp. CPCC 101601]|uniref:Uncharacterized protein n=1 Tax=Pseudogemmobacter lacusdianii TaxID=3069608 RepID=A0ABU0W261_9RHOB|nr:hypothetical protein [Xinfangfangia sp. CPCC 101601]MDQ2068111.1 hypothetical protein [Xinfangfangia sp. CPCC 101601]
MRLELNILGTGFDIQCDEGRAPRTLAKIAGMLPKPVQLHTPKIAGSHIYWHAPLIEEPEGGVDVLSAKPGAFIYWPVRQFLEITFAPLQAETASVTVLGHYEGPIEKVREMAERLRQQHGTTSFSGALTMTQTPTTFAPVAPVDHPTLPAFLLAARDAIWRACPEDLAALRESRAIMHPMGPVLMAESEARILHEMFWWLRERVQADPATSLRYAAGLSTNKAATRLRDFCHMKETPDILFQLEAAFADPAVSLPELIDLGIVIAGRIAAWLDLQIAWDPMNQAYRAALDAAVKP